MYNLSLHKENGREKKGGFLVFFSFFSFFFPIFSLSAPPGGASGIIHQQATGWVGATTRYRRGMGKGGSKKGFSAENGGGEREVAVREMG